MLIHAGQSIPRAGSDAGSVSAILNQRWPPPARIIKLGPVQDSQGMRCKRLA